MQRCKELERVPVITGLDDRPAYKVKQSHGVRSATTYKTKFSLLSVEWWKLQQPDWTHMRDCVKVSSGGAWNTPLHTGAYREPSDGCFGVEYYLNKQRLLLHLSRVFFKKFSQQGETNWVHTDVCDTVMVSKQSAIHIIGQKHHFDHMLILLSLTNQFSPRIHFIYVTI